MSGLRLTGLHSYPVKSARGTTHTEAAAHSRGLRFDRLWMVVSQDGDFLTQRNVPALATLGVEAHDDGSILLDADGREPVAVAPPPTDAARMPTGIWNDVVDAQLAAAEANAWLSDWLQRPVWLARIPDDAPRPAALAPDVDVSFADGYPFLLCTEDSLAELNGRLDAPVPMDRFRPNLVVAGAEPWAEAGWRRLRIGELEFENVKPCARCVVTTTDQATGERMGPEPLRTLADYRRNDDGTVDFGMNLVTRQAGVLRVGDPVEILD